MLFVFRSKILHNHCLQFLLGVNMASRETENNAYAKFWGDKQRALWYVMVFQEWSIGRNCSFSFVQDTYAKIIQDLLHTWSKSRSAVWAVTNFSFKTPAKVLRKTCMASISISVYGWKPMTELGFFGQNSFSFDTFLVKKYVLWVFKIDDTFSFKTQGRGYACAQ